MYRSIFWFKRVGLALFLYAAMGVSLASAETVQEFQAEYEIQSDGQVMVTEEIEYDFAAAERHGIFRTLSTQHPQDASVWYKERYLDITIQSVLRNGAAVPYTVTDGRSELEVRIGDPDRTVTGVQNYTIQYRVDGGLSTTPQGGGEFYWNVTGADWSVPLERVTVSVVGAEAGLLAPAYSCYQGPAGDTVKCTTATPSINERRFVAEAVSPGAEVTVAVAVSDSVTVQSIERWSMIWLLLVGLAVWLIVLVVWVWRYRTQDDPNHPVVPQYEPFAGYRPMYTGVLFDGKLNPHDITAGILYLAEQGFLRIQKTDKPVLWVFSGTDYKIDLRREMSETETVFQRELLYLLFGTNGTVGDTVSLSELKNSTASQKANRSIIARLKKGIEADLVTRGFYEKAYQPVVRQGGVAITALLFGAGLVVFLDLAGFQFFFAACFLALLTILTLAAVSHRRTAKGYRAQNHLQGFKRFLAMTGTERFAFHDAPEKSPEQFTEYLPYAVAFAVEKEWAEVFADITIPQPSWYSDSTGSQQFVATSLVSDLSGFSQNFSQSSGSSASSGGGSAGGGAGGGGGGSW